MATREDYKAGATFRVVSDCANFAEGALLRPYTAKDDGSNSPGFVRADLVGEVGYSDWDYEELKHLEVVTEGAPAVSAAVVVERLQEDVGRAMEALSELAPAFQAMLLTGISAECLRVSELLKKSIK
jgi:hypothetical protein